MVKSTTESRKTSKGKEKVNPSHVKSTKLVQQTLARRKLTQQAQTKLTTIKNKITTFATHKGISPETVLKIIAKITQDVTDASDQKRTAMKILENIKENEVIANTVPE